MEKNIQEIWKDISGYEGLYQVSNLGRIKSLKGYYHRKEKILKSGIRNGYYVINLSKKRERKSYQVHRLVAQAFIPNPDNYLIINHKDENPLNNYVGNLEWCSQKHNVCWSSYKMRKRKGITHSNTNEKYITYDKRTDSYRLTIDKKEYRFKTLKEAIKKRDYLLKEMIR